MRLHELLEALNKKNLSEYRRNPELNRKVSTADQLLGYADDPTITISFSTLKKVGIYPHSGWHTPNAVYTYPLAPYKIQLQYTGEVNKIFPFASDRPYIFVIKNKAQTPLNFDHDVTPQQLKRSKELIKAIADMSKDKLDVASMRSLHIEESPHKTTSMQIYYAFMTFSVLGIITTNQFNKFLRMCGFDAIIDNDLGIIHINEPRQVCFLTPTAYEVVDVIHNDTMVKPHKHHYYGTGARNQDTVFQSDEVVVVNGEHIGKEGVVLAIREKNKIPMAYVDLDIDENDSNKIIVPLSDLKRKN